MRYAQSDYVPQNIKSLRQQLPPFNAGAEADLSANTALCEYLNFYRLPSPNNNLKLLAGHLSGDDQQTHIMAWQPADAVGTAIVVHGYLDHIGLYRNLISELLQRRMNVVCFDLIGHGLSTG